MVEKSQDNEMDKSVAVGNVENNSEKFVSWAKWTRDIKKALVLQLFKID